MVVTQVCSLPPSLPSFLPSFLLVFLPSSISPPSLPPSLLPSLPQARVTWFFSRLLLFETTHDNEGGKEGGREGERKGNKSENLAMATHGFNFLKERMWDGENGGFVWRVAADGKTVLEVGREGGRDGRRERTTVRISDPHHPSLPPSLPFLAGHVQGPLWAGIRSVHSFLLLPGQQR